MGSSGFIILILGLLPLHGTFIAKKCAALLLWKLFRPWIVIHRRSIFVSLRDDIFLMFLFAVYARGLDLKVSVEGRYVAV